MRSRPRRTHAFIGESRRCATAYCTISESELIPIFCMMLVLWVLTVFHGQMQAIGDLGNRFPTHEMGKYLKFAVG